MKSQYRSAFIKMWIIVCAAVIVTVIQSCNVATSKSEDGNGTAYVFEDGQYVGKRRCAFCGFFPYGNPRYSCIVVCEGGERGAAASSGKAFGGIAQELLGATFGE